MKKQLLLIICIFLLSKLSGQILCIQCYQQNDSVYAGGVNLIQNGGFENTNCVLGNVHSFCPNSTNYDCNIANWLCTGGGSFTYAQIFDNTVSLIPEGLKAAYFGNFYCKACSQIANDTSCVNNVLCSIDGIPAGFPTNDSLHGGSLGISLEQTISGIISGATYILEFWAGGEGAQSRKGLFAVDVGFGNTFLRNKPTFNVTGVGTRYLIAFQTTSSIQTIKFTNWGHIFQTCTELVLDDIKLYQWNGPTSPCNFNLGINELTENTITLYPNPATDKLTIENSSLVIGHLSLVKIVNVLGEVVFQSEIHHPKSEIDIKNYEQGVYFVEIKSGEEVMRKRFVKQ